MIQSTRRTIKRSLSSLLMLLLAGQVFAFTPFVVKHIRFTGLNRIPKSSVLTYLPIKVGQTMTEAKSTTVVQNLFATGFFDDISVKRDKTSLVIHVVERPVITSIKIAGNTSIKTEQLQKVLKSLGLNEGRVYNPSNLALIKSSLTQQYETMGNYAASVKVDAKQLDHNRVAISINIAEGAVRTIRAINFYGNHVFSSHKLRDQFKLTTPGLWTFFTKSDEFSQSKFDQDLQSLTEYYLNHGYVEFKIVSSKADITQDNQHVVLNTHVSEGPKYHFAGVDLQGDMVLPKAKLMQQIHITKGSPFSRQAVINNQRELSYTLGEHAYAFALIRVIPRVDKVKHTVFITYDISAGQRYYVRHINFTGNMKTKDSVIRRPLLQMEGGPVNLKRINDSMRKLNVLGYIKNVNHQLKRVPGTDNQVDMGVNFTELPAAQVSVGGGYSTLEKFLVTASLSQQNFLGTGNALNVDFSNSAYRRSYSVNFDNPYFTDEGVSRGYSLYYNKYKPGLINLTDSYTYDTYGGDMHFGVPLNLYDRITFGAGLQHIHLVIGSTPPDEIASFRDTYGTSFSQGLFNLGWLHNSYDRAIFPTTGLETGLNGMLAVPLAHDSLHYYKLSSHVQWYQPLTTSRSFIFMLSAGVRYGHGYSSTDKLPFFTNYYAGGIDASVPVAGFDDSSLGPVDSKGNHLGGNFGLHGRVGIIWPQTNENLRIISFIDAGNVYNTQGFTASEAKYNKEEADISGMGYLRKLRYSAGVALEYQIFLGTLRFSLAKPLTNYANDSSRVFAFSFGTSF